MTCHNCRIECRKRTDRQRPPAVPVHCSAEGVYLKPATTPVTGMYLARREGRAGPANACSKATAFRASSALPAFTTERFSSCWCSPVKKCERIMAEKIRNVEVRDVECRRTLVLHRQESKSVSARRRSEPGRLLHVRCDRAPYQAGAEHRHGQSATSEPPMFSLRACAWRPPASTSRSPRTASRPTVPRSPRRCTTVATSRSSSRSTASQRRRRPLQPRRSSSPWR